MSNRIFRWAGLLLPALCLSCLGQSPALRRSAEFVNETDGLDLNALIMLAGKKHPSLLAAGQDTLAARGLLRQAGLRPNSTLEAGYLSGALIGNRGEDQFSLQLSQTFERGKKRENRQETAGKEIEIREARERWQEWKLDLAVKRAYFEALAAVRLLAAAEKMEQLSDESLRFASVRAAAGEGSQLEVRLLEVEKNRIAAERPLLTGNAETAFEELGALVGTPPRNLTLKDRDAVLFDTPELASLIATALRNHPELGVARAAVAKAEAEIKLAKAQAIQDVTGFVQFGKARSQNAQFGLDGAGRRAQVRDNDNVLGAGLSMSLPFRNRNQGNIAAAEAELRAAQFRASSVSLQLEREVRTAFLRYRAASAAIRGLSENVLANARSNLETIRKAYELGELRILDVLQEQRRLVELDRTANEVRSLESKALLDLEQATGLSIVTTTGGAR